MRVTLNPGDVWTAEIANKVAYPKINTLADWGSIDLITDVNMSDASDQLKARSYAFLDRIKITAVSGLIVNIAGGYYLRSDGSIATVIGGNFALPADTSGIVYLDSNGDRQIGTTLPGIADPLARFVTNATDVVTLTGVRIQDINRASATGNESGGFFKTGDVKFSLAPTIETGWLLCNGGFLDPVTYPDLFSAIGYKFGQSGSLFQLPGEEDFTLVATATLGNVGEFVGSNSKTPNINQLIPHTHGVIDGQHTHGSSQSPHGHDTIDSGHFHNHTDGGHSHLLERVRGAALNADVNDGTGAELSTQGQGSFPRTDNRTSNISINSALTGISVKPANVNVTINSAPTGISIASAGNGQPLDVQNRGLRCYMLIKT
jgi:microcystin-dependent protein